MTTKEKLLKQMSDQCGQTITEINLISWDMVEPHIAELESNRLEHLVRRGVSQPVKLAGELQIIYKHNKPHGIRDKNGYLLFFTRITKYDGQEDRYREEIEEQLQLADYLVEQLSKFSA